MAVSSQPTQAPQEPSKLQKNATTLGRSMLSGATRGLWSGAWQFGKNGFVISTVLSIGLIAAGLIGFNSILAWTLGAAAVGAVGMLVINLGRGLLNGLKENHYRNRAESVAAKAQEQEQGKGQDRAQTVNRAPDLSNTVSPGANSAGVSGGSNSVKVNGEAASTISSSASVGSNAPSSESSPETATNIASSVPKGNVAYGQGPNVGGSWEELVRRNSSAHNIAR